MGLHSNPAIHCSATEIMLSQGFLDLRTLQRHVTTQPDVLRRGAYLDYEIARLDVPLPFAGVAIVAELLCK